MSRIRADQLVNRLGSGGPKFPHGVAEGFSVSGIVTATSYRGDGSQLTGIDASSLKDGSDVKIQATNTGATVTGSVAATGDVSAVNGTFSGNLTVNGTTTTIDTAVTSVDSLAVDGNVGIGTTNALAKLHVNLATDRNIAFNVDGDGQSRISSFNDTSSVSQVLGLNGSELSFQTSNTERVRVTSNGKVGIGTDDPAYNLSILASGVVRHQITCDDNNAAGAGIYLRTLNSGTQVSNATIRTSNDGNFQIFTGTDTDAERLRITSVGHILPGADNTQDLGSSAKRFANIYTGDLNLSNEGSANDVDGTWGQYTIQEGEDDLFLINRRTGKKYKFNLTEVN